MKKEYVAILTVYNRLPYLDEQIAALLNQSIPPKQIYVWVNKDMPIQKNSNAKYIISDENFKFWGRFALAQIMQSEYIMILDDDTIPGKKWAENCFSSFSSKPGIYGAVTPPTTARRSTQLMIPMTASWRRRGQRRRRLPSTPQTTRSRVCETP